MNELAVLKAAGRIWVTISNIDSRIGQEVTSIEFKILVEEAHNIIKAANEE